MKLNYRLSIFYGILGLVLGVFYREYTKLSNYFEATSLSVLHVHALIMGMFFFLLLLVFNKLFKVEAVKGYLPWLISYNIGLLGLLASMLTRGVLLVEGIDIKGLNHVAGLFHAILGISIIWFFIILRKSFKVEGCDSIV